MTISTHTFEAVNVGSAANDGTGDDLRTAFITVNDNFQFMSNTGFNAGGINVTGSIAVTGNVNFANTYVPATAGASGTAGQLSWDNNYLYVCIATNTWKRANISTW